MTEDQFRSAVAEFVGTFEVVFRYDWDYTKIMIGDVPKIVLVSATAR